MRILIVGSGGREHALAWKLRQSPAVEQIFCAPGNVGTALLGENVAITAGDLVGLAGFAKQNRIGLTVVGPDDPLAAGIVDLFQGQRLRIFGPTKSAARIEASKIFAKQLMHAAGIPTAEAQVFTSSEQAFRYCDSAKYPVVIKADGLALGKGVIIARDQAMAGAAIDAMMNRARFGEAGRRIVVEEFLSGSECSLHALVDSTSYLLLATARDHKRVFDGDQGPNTGGMGAVSPASNWTNDLEQKFDRQIMQPLLDGLKQQQVRFNGLLFPGLMITAEGPRVLEFNCRFGDPETQAILPRMTSDLLPLLEATIDGTIASQNISWDDRVAVTVVLASGGYPDKYDTGKPITGLNEAAAIDGVEIFHAGTRELGGRTITSGGRVLAVTALGAGVEAARAQAYKAIGCIRFDGCHYRKDIALTV
jgi:phosphoribosylamine---glycine ligase